jgi:uncharacterized protein (UPF0332 family)/predicted nucleotidyltransferase
MNSKPGLVKTLSKVRNNPQEALEIFSYKVLNSPVAEQVLRLCHFGSTQSGNWHEESDIDVLVVATGYLPRVEETLLDLSWEVMEITGWLVEPLVYCPESWEHPSLFLKRLGKNYKEIFSVDESEERRAIAEDLAQLAYNYLEMAEQLDPERHTRGVIDLAYNAAELIAKAWLVYLGEPIPRTHNGVIVRFGERVVQAGHVSPEIGRRLRRALGRRNRARYEPHTTDLPSEAQEVLTLACSLVEAWEQG